MVKRLFAIGCRVPLPVGEEGDLKASALGTDAPNVAGLVYVAAFGLDEGESMGALLDQGPPSPTLAQEGVTQLR
jgi:hypothetical protein